MPRPRLQRQQAEHRHDGQRRARRVRAQYRDSGATHAFRQGPQGGVSV